MLNALARSAQSADPAAADPAVEAARLAAANVNPATGLSTDYLNHFNEAIMLLEMLPSMPECQEDFLAWGPLDYHQHFLRSGLTQSETAIAAYDRAEPRVRQAFDAVCGEMRSAVLTAQAALAQAAPADAIAEETLARLKRLAARASAVIHGHDPVGAAAAIEESQAAIDAILQP